MLSKRLSQYCWLVPEIKDTSVTKAFFILMHLGGDICFMCAGVGKGKKRLSDPWIWSFRRLNSLTCMLGAELKS